MWLHQTWSPTVLACQTTTARHDAGHLEWLRSGACKLLACDMGHRHFPRKNSKTRWRVSRTMQVCLHCCELQLTYSRAPAAADAWLQALLMAARVPSSNMHDHKSVSACSLARVWRAARLVISPSLAMAHIAATIDSSSTVSMQQAGLMSREAHEESLIAMKNSILALISSSSIDLQQAETINRSIELCASHRTFGCHRQHNSNLYWRVAAAAAAAMYVYKQCTNTTFFKHVRFRTQCGKQLSHF